MKARGNIDIQSKNTHIHGAKIASEGELSIDAKGDVYIGLASMLTSEFKDIDYNMWGGGSWFGKRQDRRVCLYRQ